MGLALCALCELMGPQPVTGAVGCTQTFPGFLFDCNLGLLPMWSLACSPYAYISFQKPPTDMPVGGLANLNGALR